MQNYTDSLSSLVGCLREHPARGRTAGRTAVGWAAVGSVALSVTCDLVCVWPAVMQTRSSARASILPVVLLLVIVFWSQHGQWLLTPSLLPEMNKDVRMPMVTLANGVKMPLVAYGTADQPCLQPCQDDDGKAFGPYFGLGNETLIRASQCGHKSWYGGLSTYDSVREAYTQGFRAFDTANDYCTQPTVGDALRSLGVPRSTFFISTKVPPYNADTWGGPIVHAALYASLYQMQVDYVDLMMIHEPDFSGTCAANQAAWRYLEDYYLAGKARAIGVSNFCRAALECILQTARIVPMINQLNYHIGVDDPEGLLPLMAQHGIVLVAWDPSDSTESILLRDEPSYAELDLQTRRSRAWQRRTPHMKALTSVEGVARTIAEKYGASRLDVFLRWLVQKNDTSAGGTPFVIATKNPRHMASDLRAVTSAGWTLSDDDMASLSRLRVPVGDRFGTMHPYAGSGVCGQVLASVGRR